MKQTAQQHKNMKQLMKSKLRRNIRLFQHINNAADCIADSTGSQQKYCSTAHRLENRKIKQNCPAHSNVQCRLQPTGRRKPAQFNNNADTGAGPDCNGKNFAFQSRQILQQNRRIGSCNQHINHGMIQLAQYQ